MSYQETIKGKIKPVVLNGKTNKEFMLSMLEKKDCHITDDIEDDFLSYFYEKYVIVKDTIYEFIDVKDLHEEGFFEFEKCDDGSINFFASFYNGGTCLSELFEENL